MKIKIITHYTMLNDRALSLLSDSRTILSVKQIELLGRILSECELIINVFEVHARLAIILLSRVDEACIKLAQAGISLKAH